MLLLYAEEMARQRYFLDKDTLTFKPVDTSFIVFVRRTYKYMIGLGVVSFILFFTLSSYHLTPHEYLLSIKNKKLAAEIVDRNMQISTLGDKLEFIQENDDVIYRPFVDIKPLPKSVREVGTGGIDKYRQFAGLVNSDSLVGVFKNIDKLQDKIRLQEKSFEDIEQMVTYIDGYYASKPAIRPILKKDNHYISSPFGRRFHPIHKRFAMHTGVDYAVTLGTPVYATGSGVVKGASYASGYGKVIKIKHGYGYESFYAHLSKYIVHKGDTVKRGQLVGYSGNSGTSTGPHLHYEVRKNNRPQNPLLFYIDDLKDEEFLMMAEK